MHKAVNPPEVPFHPSYSQGIVATGSQTLYVAGQVGIGPDGKPRDGIAAQTEAAIANVGAVLAAAGMTLANVARLTVYLTDESNFPGFMETFSPRMPSPQPAGTLVIVKSLADPSYLVEIEAIAVK